MHIVYKMGVVSSQDNELKWKMKQLDRYLELGYIDLLSVWSHVFLTFLFETKLENEQKKYW